jgi:hypothetical protein
MYNQKSVKNFSFLLQINYNKFTLKILYTDEVGWKEHVWFFYIFVNFVSSYIYDIYTINPYTHDMFS